MRHRSPIFAEAVEKHHACRAEYGDYLEASFGRAQDAVSGNLLNRRGRDAGIDAFTLFKGNAATANAYASEELQEHWRRYPRLTFAQFERQWFDSQYDAGDPAA